MINTSSKAFDVDVILIDNFDSFTYNLVNQISPLVNQVIVYRNNMSLEEISKKIDGNAKPVIIMLSPGPGTPNEAGITLDLIARYQGKTPIFGICLGHQAIIQSFGGTIDLARTVTHGKTSEIQIDESKFDERESRLFENLRSPFRVARYHSLAATNVPQELKIIAQAEGEIMAVAHASKRILGYQFHPESILTTKGDQLMKNSLRWLMGEQS